MHCVSLTYTVCVCVCARERPRVHLWGVLSKQPDEGGWSLKTMLSLSLHSASLGAYFMTFGPLLVAPPFSSATFFH